jgi:hypothetical protein
MGKRDFLMSPEEEYLVTRIRECIVNTKQEVEFSRQDMINAMKGILQEMLVNVPEDLEN